MKSKKSFPKQRKYFIGLVIGIVIIFVVYVIYSNFFSNNLLFADCREKINFYNNQVNKSLNKFDTDYESKLKELAPYIKNEDNLKLQQLKNDFIAKVVADNAKAVSSIGPNCEPSNDINSDISAGIVNTYTGVAEEFDAAVSQMIENANTRVPQAPQTGGSAVSTDTLTTDAMLVQAQQSIRDTVRGASGTVFETVQELAQQMGQ